MLRNVQINRPPSRHRRLRIQNLHPVVAPPVVRPLLALVQFLQHPAQGAARRDVGEEAAEREGAGGLRGVGEGAADDEGGPEEEAGGEVDVVEEE